MIQTPLPLTYIILSILPSTTAIAKPTELKLPGKTGGTGETGGTGGTILFKMGQAGEMDSPGR
jgi:hypothetical protein